MPILSGLQTTQPTSGGAVTNCCATCVEPSRPQVMGAQFTIFCQPGHCRLAGWLALLLTKAGDVETNPGPTASNK